jgi:hypothetical protein
VQRIFGADQERPVLHPRHQLVVGYVPQPYSARESGTDVQAICSKGEEGSLPSVPLPSVEAHCLRVGQCRTETSSNSASIIKAVTRRCTAASR